MAVPVSIATEERGNFKIHVSHLVLQTFGMRLRMRIENQIDQIQIEFHMFEVKFGMAH